MIVSVASGKGGTGKTTIVTNLALVLDNPQVIDCDVEEPNANIFLNSKIQESEQITVEIPLIDKGKCDYCGKCSEFCAYNAIAVVPKEVLIFPELCHSCGGCELVCPNDAVQWKEKSLGVVEHGFANGIDFYQGILNVGELMAIPVIKSLKKKIDRKKNVLLDAPPGTSCPVIETITGTDYCILVTEPTPFGLHDLKLAVDVVRHLNIPFGVIINRDGVGDKNVQIYCRKEKIPILLKIPQSEKIAKLYSSGKPFVKEMRDWPKKFTDLITTIQRETVQ
jgi:MinD superfamily P-loop ATPase